MHQTNQDILELTTINMKNEIFTCDIKGCKSTAPQNVQKRIQVIFTTDQTEGRSVKPYLSEADIDICAKCLDNVLEGNYIYANGAMGHNEYYFKS